MNLCYKARKYNETKFYYVVSISKQILVKVLILSFNDSPQIPKKLSSTYFPFLQVLDLSCNQIESIQSFKKLDLKSLKLLNLQGNKITKINGLVQSYFPVLQNLSIKLNKYSQYDKLSTISCLDLKIIQLNQIPVKRKVIKIISVQAQLVFS